MRGSSRALCVCVCVCLCVHSSTVLTSTLKSNEPREKDKKKASSRTHESGLLESTLKGHTDDVYDARFSPDGRTSCNCCAILSYALTLPGAHVVTTSGDRTIRVWPVAALRSKEHPCARNSVALDHAVSLNFSPDGKYEFVGFLFMCVFVCH